MKSSLSYWITIYEDDGTELWSGHVYGWETNAGIQIDGGGSDQASIEAIQKYTGKKMKWERAWEEITQAEQELLPSQSTPELPKN